MKNPIPKVFVLMALASNFSLLEKTLGAPASTAAVSWICSSEGVRYPVSQNYRKIEMYEATVAFEKVVKINLDSKINFTILPTPTKTNINLNKDYFTVTAELSSGELKFTCSVDKSTGGAPAKPQGNQNTGEAKVGEIVVNPNTGGMGGAPPDPMKFGGGKKTPAQPAPKKKADEQKKKTATKG